MTRSDPGLILVCGLVLAAAVSLRADPGDSCHMARGYVRSGQARIHYRMLTHANRDHGRLMVYFHGGPGGNTLVFREAVGRLFARDLADVLLIDQRGCGASSFVGVDPTTYNLEQSVEDMHRVITSVMRQRRWEAAPILMGHSFGAALAVAYCQTYSGVFDDLVLVSPALSRHDIRRWARKEAEQAPIPSNEMGRRFASSRELSIYRELCRRGHDPVRTEVTGHFLAWGGWGTLDLSLSLHGLRQRVLILGGAEDGLTPPPTLQILARIKDGTHLELIPGSGHHPYLLDPAGFVDRVVGAVSPRSFSRVQD